MTRFAYTLALLAALSGCGGGRSDGAPTTTPQPPALPGTYTGRFPCSNCAAIDATLWLTRDGRFFLRQHFTSEEAGAATSSTYSLGRWGWDEVAAQLALTGAGPERRLAPFTPDGLELLVASPNEHRLTRAANMPPLTDRLTLDGESAVSERGATFRECLTGLTLAVAETGAYRELRRQHRRMNPRGKVALTTIEAHFAAASGEASSPERLVIERFITLKPGQPCPAR